MRKFVFHLEPVLRLRVYAEQQCQRDLASAQGELQAICGELEELEAALCEATEELHSRFRTSAVNSIVLNSHARHAESLGQLIKVTQRRREESRTRLTSAEQALNSATTARKSLEILRDRAHEQWLTELRATERRELDEIAVRKGPS